MTLRGVALYTLHLSDHWRDINATLCLRSLQAGVPCIASLIIANDARQWRSKALRGPGSTVTWDPPFPFPPLPHPSPSFPLSLVFPSPAPPLPRCGPQIQLGDLGERCKLPPAGSGAEPKPKSNLVHFSLKIRHLVAIILKIFLRVLPKIFLWPHYSGAPGARGPRFIEPPEPPVLTPDNNGKTLSELCPMRLRYGRVSSERGV